jgi:hypothetical protein
MLVLWVGIFICDNQLDDYCEALRKRISIDTSLTLLDFCEENTETSQDFHKLENGLGQQ